MKKTFLIISFITSIHPLVAQDKPDYKNDVGFSTNFIIGQFYQSSAQTPFSVMLKRYVTSDKAFRIGMDAAVDMANSSGNNNPQDSYSDQHNVSVSLILGKEFQKSISRHWKWYWGMDLAPRYSQYYTENFRDNEKLNTYKTRAYGMDVKPLAGIRFNIHERLYLAIETSASLTVKAFENETVQYGAEVTRQHTNGTVVNFHFLPASSLFLFYRF